MVLVINFDMDISMAFYDITKEHRDLINLLSKWEIPFDLRSTSFGLQFRKSFWLHILTIELVITGLGSDRRARVIKQRDNSPIWDQNTRPARARARPFAINQNKV